MTQTPVLITDDRAGQAGCLLGAVRRADPARRRRARRRAGGHPRAAGARRARRASTAIRRACRSSSSRRWTRSACTVEVRIGAAIGRRPVRAGRQRLHATCWWCSAARSPRGRFTEVARRLAALGVNIDAIRSVADYPVTGLELYVSVDRDTAEADAALRSVLADAAVEAAGSTSRSSGPGSTRRAKRLVVFDVDSTLIQGEVIEMLGAHAGVRAGDPRDHRGRHARRAELHGVAANAGSRCWRACPRRRSTRSPRRCELTPGARTTVRTLKRLGFRLRRGVRRVHQVIERAGRRARAWTSPPRTNSRSSTAS